MLLRSFSILVVFSAFATLHADQKPDSAAKIKIVDIVNDQTVKVVAAAEELLATLSDDERAKTIFKFNDEDQRLRWSNLPTGIFERKGLRMGDLKQEQIDAVMGLIKATMSSDGYQQVVDNMAGEETLKDGGRGRLVFGRTNTISRFLAHRRGRNRGCGSSADIIWPSMPRLLVTRSRWLPVSPVANRCDMQRTAK
jgi:hypothetical protein